MSKTGIWIGGGVMAAIIALVTALNTFTVVSVGEEGVTSSFGVVHEDPIYGFNVVMPWYSVDSYSNQSQTRTWDDVGIPSQDKFKTNMDISYTGNFVVGAGPAAREATGTADAYMRTHVDKKVLACSIKAGSTITKSQMFFEETTQRTMANYVTDCTNKYLLEEAQAAYVVSEVQFTDIRLDKRVEGFMVKTKEREEAEEQQKSDTRRANEKAQIKVQDSLAAAQAAENKRIERQHLADASFYEKQKEAEGNRALADSITPELIDYLRAKQWNGQYPQQYTTLSEGKATMLIK